MIFDTHCHLNIQDLNNNLDEVILLAKKSGVEKILIPGVTIESSESAINIAKKYADVYVGVGVHPTDSKDDDISQINTYISILEKLIISNKVVAVGEIGLDYHKNPTLKEREYQQKLFFEQLKLSQKFKKAVIVHNRESKNDLLRILSANWEDFFSHKMVFHCCEPDIELLNFAKEKGIYVGIDGDITYKKSKQEFVKLVPLDMLVLETDSPFLVPEPLKSQKVFPNEPKNLNLISNYVGELLGRNKCEFEKQIWENSNKLFFD